MSIACSRSRVWFQRSITSWLQDSRCNVSTTSAINRGLRKTRDERPHNARRAEPDRNRFSNGEYSRTSRLGGNSFGGQGSGNSRRRPEGAEKSRWDKPSGFATDRRPDRAKKSHWDKPSGFATDRRPEGAEKSHWDKPSGFATDRRPDRAKKSHWDKASEFATDRRPEGAKKSRWDKPSGFATDRRWEKGNEQKKYRFEDENTSRLRESSKASKIGSQARVPPSAKNYSKPAPNSDMEQVSPDEDEHPLSVPYSTSASVFLYGSNTVFAALRGKNRKMHHLYINQRLSAREESSQSIEKMAQTIGVPVTYNANLRLLDKMSENRPHNGVVMETSRLPAPPVLAMGQPDPKSSIIPLDLERQSAEDMAVNGAPEALSSPTNSWRHPFVLMLDGILDPGNVGSILRSAHFFGVDAVAIATNTCANINSATLAKASSGACEGIAVLALPKPANFIYRCRKAGWHAYAAVAPPGSLHGQTSAERARTTTTTALSRDSPLAKHPCILMLGAEGEGLRENLRLKADVNVSIERGQRSKTIQDVGVESLNVGVAAGVLIEAFLKRPAGAEGGMLGF